MLVHGEHPIGAFEGVECHARTRWEGAHQRLRRHVAGGTRRVGTSAKPASTGIEGRDAKLGCDKAVGDRLGVNQVRTLAPSLARAPLVAWLDADDTWRPGYLERQVAVLDAEPEVAFTFANFVRTEDGVLRPETQFDLCPEFRALATRAAGAGGAKVIEGSAFEALAAFGEMPCWIQATVHRRAVVMDLQPKPGDMDAEDLYFQLQVYARGRAAFIEDPLVEVRRHGDNSYSSSDQVREGVLTVLHELERTVPLTPSQLAVLHRRIGKEFCRRGYRYFWAHDMRRAARYYAQALRWPGTRRSALLHLALLPALPLLPRREPRY